MATGKNLADFCRQQLPPSDLKKSPGHAADLLVEEAGSLDEVVDALPMVEDDGAGDGFHGIFLLGAGDGKAGEIVGSKELFGCFLKEFGLKGAPAVRVVVAGFKGGSKVAMDAVDVALTKGREPGAEVWAGFCDTENADGRGKA